MLQKILLIVENDSNIIKIKVDQKGKYDYFHLVLETENVSLFAGKVK